MARFTKGKGWRVIAFLRVPVAMDVAMDILPLEKILGGVSKCPHNICAETAVTSHPGHSMKTVLRNCKDSDGKHQKVPVPIPEPVLPVQSIYGWGELF